MLVAAHDAAEAGLVSASAAALTQGVLRTMLFTKLKWTALALMTAGTIAAGTGVYGTSASAVPEACPGSRGRRDDSDAPVTESVVSDDSENSRREKERTADPSRSGSCERLASIANIADKIAELTRAARTEQEEGNFRHAAEVVGAIEDLASHWRSILRQVDPRWGLSALMTKLATTPAGANRPGTLAEVLSELERSSRHPP